MLTSDELFAILYPKNEQQFMKVLSGYDRGFLKSFLSGMRAILKGDFAAIRRNKRNGLPYYDSLTGTWRQSDGQAIKPEKQIRYEIKELEKQLVNLTRRYLRDSTRDAKDRPSIPKDLINKWQAKAAEIIINGNLRAYNIGKGENLDHIKISGHIKKELQYLEGFARDIESGNLRRYSIVDRVKMYADSVLLSYSQGDIDQKVKSGDWEGWRQLDPSAAHCPECPGYATTGYVDASQIMPIGCCSSCMRRCKCSIKWRLKKETYYQDLMGINANLLDKAEIAAINFQYYKRMGLDTKAEARRYSILKRSIGHQAALEQVLKEKRTFK